MITFAKFVSFLFHPVIFFILMPFIVVYKQTGSSLYALKWQAFSSLVILAGIFLIVIGKWRKSFSDFDLSKKEERMKFYFVLLLLASAYLIIALFFKGIFFYLSIITFGISMGIVLLIFLNYYLKVSIHLAVACAFVVAMHVISSETPMWYTFWIVPLVAWARLTLKRHTAYEIVIGGFLGVIVTIATFLIGQYLYS